MKIVITPAEQQPIEISTDEPIASNSQPPFWWWPLIFVGIVVTVALLFKKITVEDIEQSLTPEELEEYQAVQKKIDDKHEDCEQYFLVALVDGKRLCRSCPPGISFVTLKKGEIFYIGYTCLGDARYSRSFLDEHEVSKLVNFTGTRDQCHNMELKLINGYKYLEESLKPEAKLVIPPYNINKMN